MTLEIYISSLRKADRFWIRGYITVEEYRERVMILAKRYADELAGGASTAELLGFTEEKKP